MKLKYPLSVFIPAIALIFSTGSSFAQDTKTTEPKTEPAKSTMAEEIEVVRPYKPVLANAAKVRRNPDLNDTKPFRRVLIYDILDKKLELNTDIRQLQYQQLSIPDPSPIQNNYAKLGLGNLRTGLGELYINTGRDEALQAGFFAKHIAQKGVQNYQQFSKQEFGLFGKNMGSKHTLSGKADFKRLGTYFYGGNPVALVDVPQKQQLQEIKLEGELASHYNNTPQEWTYALKAQAALFKNKIKAQENSIILSAFAHKNGANQFNFGLNTSADFTQIKQQTTTSGNNLLRVNPYAQYQGEGFKLKLGMNIVQEFGISDRLNLLPALSIEAPVSPNQVSLFAGLSGDIQKTSLNELSFQNPFLSQNINIKNALEKSNIYAGLKGTLSTAVGFKVQAYFKNIDQMPLFVNSGTNLSQFEVIYDAGKSKVTGFEAEVNIKASDVFEWSTKIQTANYKLASEAQAWFKPELRLETQARAQVNKSLELTASLVFNGETYGKISNAAPENQAVKIKSFMDLSAGGQYTLKKKWGVFLQANNILGTAYQQYLYYPNLGFQIFGGINYSF